MKRLPLALAVLLVVAGVPAPTMADDDGRPLADAGLDQSATVGSTVYLDGGGSVDPDGEIVAYNWTIRTPDGETITPVDPEAETTRFVPHETGRYHVELTVTGDDGREQRDTLYVDVEAAEPPASTPEPTATPESGNPTPAPPSTEQPSERSPPSHSPPDGATNQAPTGTIAGPSTVTSGSTVTYTIDASDPDGEVSDRRWAPTTLSTSGAWRSDFRGTTRTITVDGTPGTTATVSATVVDDDGARTTLTKAVEVVNTPPHASIEGDGTAVVNATKEYRLTASDPDSEITSVRLSSGSGAVEATEPMPWDGSTSSGEWARSFRFTEIPEDDATVTFAATVRDEFGGVATVEKEVTVVGGTNEVLGENPVSKSRPEILSLDAFPMEGPEGLNERQIKFTAAATSESSDRLTFEWKIGEIAQLETSDGGEPAHGNVSHFLNDFDESKEEIPITLTVRDQNGKERTASTKLNVEKIDTTGGVPGNSHPIQITGVQGTRVHGIFQLKSSHAGQQIFLQFGDDTAPKTVTLGDTTEHKFSHQYDSGGRYSISISPSWSSGAASVPVDVDGLMYEVYEFEEKTTSILQTPAAESPGENWTQGDVIQVKREQVGIETMRTVADGDLAITSPGQGWERNGTVTEYNTERRTTESTTNPGKDWTLAERNVDQKRVVDEWQYTNVPQKGLLGSDWEYVETVQKPVESTQTKRSTTKPDGSGWKRGEDVGLTRTGYRTKTVDTRYHADSSWTYLGRERYVSGYEKTSACVEYVWFTNPPTCTESETRYKPEYDYRYEYRVPVYDTLYKWTRTVERTETEYRYREPIYTTEAINKYEKTVRVGTDYVQWEKPKFETTDIYQWEKTEESWEEATSLEKPIGDVRNVDRILKKCGEQREQDEPKKCSRGEN